MRRILLVDRTSPHAFDGRGQTYRRLLQQSHLPHRQAPLLHVPLRSARRTRSWARRGSLSRSEHPQRLRSSAPCLPLSLPVSSAPALSPSPSSVLVFVCAYALLWVNYAIFVVPLTAYVVSLLALFGIPEPFVHPPPHPQYPTRRPDLAHARPHLLRMGKDSPLSPAARCRAAGLLIRE